jgi:hypothetical protein
MRSYGPRFDPDGIVQHATVATVAEYGVQTILWRRKVAGGTIRCELLSAAGPAKRIVQLVAEYPDGDTICTVIRKCADPEEEMLGVAYLERVIIQASRRGAPAGAERPGPSAP